jgi:hypothetical protein
MPATRTQIYLTERQRRQLDALRQRDGRSLADHVRAALDLYLAREGAADLDTALDATFGVIPDMAVPSRDEWDRG